MFNQIKRIDVEINMGRITKFFNPLFLWWYPLSLDAREMFDEDIKKF